MQSEKVQKAWNEGPVGHLGVWPTSPWAARWSPPSSSTSSSAPSSFTLTRVALPGPPPSRVFQVAATAGILAYCFSAIPNAVWKGSYTRTIVANVIDGIAYGASTGAIFAWRHGRTDAASSVQATRLPMTDRQAHPAMNPAAAVDGRAASDAPPGG